MYKRYTVEQVKDYGLGLVRNLEKIMKNERLLSIKDLIKSSFILWNEVQYRDWSEPVFRIIKPKNAGSNYTLIDEKERIELHLDERWIISLNSLFRYVTQSRSKKEDKDMLSNLLDKYDWWNFRVIEDKNYLVYDIETLMATSNLKWTDFQLWYSIESWDENNHEKCFRYIEKDNLKKYVDYLIDYDGWIVWFNNVWFDNIVVCYTLWYTQEQIDILNNKSLDIFYYIRNLTWKRIWLNKVSSALIWLNKVLTWWWAEWSELLKQWLNNWDTKALNKVKEYCKWDVKMTLWVLLYLMEQREFYIEGKKYVFDEKQFTELANNIKNKSNKKDSKEKSLF